MLPTREKAIEGAAADAASLRESLLLRLLGCQNRDGAWPYRENQTSFLEPTAWAALAIATCDREHRRLEPAEQWFRKVSRQDGAMYTGAAVEVESWATTLALIYLQHVGRCTDLRDRSIQWLERSQAIDSYESTQEAKTAYRWLGGHDPSIPGWPWLPGGHSWIEPTAYAVIGLRACGKSPDQVLQGESLLLDRQCSDGGWNYGNPLICGRDLPSQEECTAAALLALQRRADDRRVGRAVDYLQSRLTSAKTPRTAAWLCLALRLYGRIKDDDIVKVLPRPTNDTVPSDIALMLLACGPLKGHPLAA